MDNYPDFSKAGPVNYMQAFEKTLQRKTCLNFQKNLKTPEIGFDQSYGK